MSQQDCLGIRGTWVSEIQEYELEIKPTKLIKGQGLAKMLTQKNEEAIEMIVENNIPQLAMTPALQELNNLWYSDIIFFLLHFTCPDYLKGHKRRALRLKTARYCLTQEGLGWRNPNGIILGCINEQDSKKILTEFHSGFCGGHYATITTAHKILRT